MLLGKYLNKYYLKYAIFFIIGIIALIAVDYFQTLLPEYLGKLVGFFSDYTDVNLIPLDKLNQMVISILFLGVVMALGRVLWRLTIFYASKKIDGHLRHSMFKKAEQLPISFYHENKVGAVMAWFTNDLETIEEYLGWGTIMIIDAFFLSVIVVLKMFFIDPVLAGLSLIPISLIVVWGALVEKVMAQKWTEKLQAYDRVSDFAQETFTGIRVIKAFVKETMELHQFAKIARKDKDTNIRFVRISVLFDVVISIIISIITTRI
jgi:ATP-binding cassette subfamily B protein